MKKVINGIGWTIVAITMVSLICIVLTTHFFIPYISFFSNYNVFQVELALTMIFLAYIMFFVKDSSRNKWYTAFCLVIAAVAIFFRIKGVF